MEIPQSHIGEYETLQQLNALAKVQVEEWSWEDRRKLISELASRSIKEKIEYLSELFNVTLS